MSELENILSNLKELEKERKNSYILSGKDKAYHQSNTYVPIDAETFIKVIEELDERLKKLENLYEKPIFSSDR